MLVGKRFRVAYEYKPTGKRSKNLAIDVGDVVEILEEQGGGNFRARLGEKEGRVHKDMLDEDPLESNDPQSKLDEELPLLQDADKPQELLSKEVKLESLESELATNIERT